MPPYVHLSPSRTLTLHWPATGPQGLPSDGLSSFASGRQALFALATHLCPPERTGQVLLPVWVPEGVYLPFVRAGWRIIFYELDALANPDWRQLETLFAQYTFDLAVLIHYFGQSRDHLRMAELAKGHCPILEDWAHTYPNPYWRTPNKGNWALFSPTKLVGITDGAWLIGPNGISNSNKKGSWQKRYTYVFWQLLYLLASTFLQLRVPGNRIWKRISGGSYARGYQLLVELTNQAASISPLGAWLLRHTNHQKVVDNRIEQAIQYSEGLRNPHFQQLGKVGKEPFPWVGFLILVDDVKAFIAHLAQHNIRGQQFTDRWWFYEEVSLYPTARKLWQRHFLLPLHQNFSAEDIAYIIQVSNAYRKDDNSAGTTTL